MANAAHHALIRFVDNDPWVERARSKVIQSHLIFAEISNKVFGQIQRAAVVADCVEREAPIELDRGRLAAEARVEYGEAILFLARAELRGANQHEPAAIGRKAAWTAAEADLRKLVIAVDGCRAHCRTAARVAGAHCGVACRFAGCSSVHGRARPVERALCHHYASAASGYMEQRQAVACTSCSANEQGVGWCRRIGHGGWSGGGLVAFANAARAEQQRRRDQGQQSSLMCSHGKAPFHGVFASSDSAILIASSSGSAVSIQ